MRDIILFPLAVIFLLSCNQVSENRKVASAFFQEKRFNFPVRIDSIINERAKDSRTLAIAFNSTFDSTRFIISNVTSFKFLQTYPPAYYFKSQGVIVFVYSGLEVYNLGEEDIRAPQEIMEFLPDMESEPKIKEPLNIEYSFFRLDTTESEIRMENLLFNKYLPLKVIQ